jgi:ATP-dependent Lon protease
VSTTFFDLPPATSCLLPVLPLRDICLFPQASLEVVVARPGTVRALDMGGRCGGQVLTLSQKDPDLALPGARDLNPVGTIAHLAAHEPRPDGNTRVELDGLARARVRNVIGLDTLLAEVETIEEADAGDEWGPAVEALARYLHTHAKLRAFLEGQRRSGDVMSWVNLACQHLPIAASARQKLLEADARERCLKISRGLDALLRKEQAS